MNIIKPIENSQSTGNDGESTVSYFGLCYYYCVIWSATVGSGTTGRNPTFLTLASRLFHGIIGCIKINKLFI